MKSFLGGLLGLAIGWFLVNFEPINKYIFSQGLTNKDSIDQMFSSIDNSLYWLVLILPGVIFALVGWSMQRKIKL